MLRAWETILNWQFGEVALTPSELSRPLHSDQHINQLLASPLCDTMTTNALQVTATSDNQVSSSG